MASAKTAIPPGAAGARRAVGSLARLLLAGLALAASARAQSGDLKGELARGDATIESLQAAIRGAIDAAQPSAIGALLADLERRCEALPKFELLKSSEEPPAGADPAANGGGAAGAAPPAADPAADAKAKEDAAKEAERGSRERALLDVVAKGIPLLLDAIAAKPGPGAVPALLSTYEESTKRIDELEAQDLKQKGDLAKLSSRLFVLEQEKDAAKNNDRATLRADKLEADVKVARTLLLLEQRRVARDAIVEATGRVLRTAKGGEVESGLKSIEKRVDGRAPPQERAVWIGLYARLGRDEVPAELIGVAEESSKALKKGEADLQKQRESFEHVKELYFREVETGGGKVRVATVDAFNAAQKELQEATARAVATERLRGAAGRAVAAAVASLPDAKRATAGAALVAGLKGERDLETRLALIEGAPAWDDLSVRDALRKLLVDDREVKARLAALEALATLKDAGAMEVARARLLNHENWKLRAAAIGALARVPQKESIPALIAALEAETGRLREDVVAALQRLTGQSFAMSAPVWKRWWEANQASFRVEDVKPGGRARVAAWDKKGEDGKVSFYGITSVSKKVCFVLDVSASMNEAASDSGPKKKIDVAKEQLKNALTGLADGDSFAIVVFAGSATRYAPKMTTMSAAIRAKVLSWVDEKVELGPGTNIFAGMKEAFAIAGMGSKDAAYDSQIDTLFFLSDGDATVGDVTDAMELRRLVRDWNKLSRIRIHAIGVGKDPNIGLLYGIAEDSGGQFQKR